MNLRHRILDRLRDRFGQTPPSLRLVFSDGGVFDFATAPLVTITFRSPRVVRSLLTGNMSRLADAYVAGDLGVDGATRDVLEVGITLAERIGKSAWTRRLAPLLAALPGRHSPKRDQANVSHHYDVSNEFYALWLDRHMTYSCAYFRTGSENIDAAQEQKLDHICRKLRLRPGDRLLDIGCGWGGLLRWAAINFGAVGTGITLSRKQFDYAQAQIAAAGLAGQVDIRFGDYRELDREDAFDKIVSVGMYEHVGIKNLPTYFAAIRRMLRPGGMVLNHGITAGDPDGRALGPAGGDFIDRYVFPGGELPHLSRALYEVARSGLEVVDVEDLRPHYALTLLHWVGRLEANAEAAQAAAGPERYRIWRMYMAGMGYAFERGWLSVAQILAYKPLAGGMAARPWTRDYQYPARESETEAR